ncbi:MAG TPA: cytochrome c oxidase subunit 3 [Gaiella sp.]|nr:cytochrome c oxidase subunit 3 [Gaiella sp.]
MTTVELPVRPIGRPTGWWGMLIVVITEATLFAILLATYFYTRFSSPGPWPPDGEPDPRLLKPVIMTLLLMASSVTAYMAELGSRTGNLRRLHAGLAATFALGLSFLILQGFEYHEKLAELRPSTNAYGSLFYTITGLHGSHVIVGLLILAWTQFFAWRGAYASENHVAVQVSALYWHFVHVVWLFVFASLYLSPRL